MASNEHLIGYVAHENGSNYDPSIPSPSWSEVLDYAQQVGIGRGQFIQIVVLGKLHYHPTRNFDGKTIITTIGDIIRSASDIYGVSATRSTFIDVADNFPDATETLATSIANLDEVPEKVTGIIIRSI